RARSSPTGRRTTRFVGSSTQNRRPGPHELRRHAVVRLPCLEPIMATTTPPVRPPVPPSAGPAVPLSLPDAEALGERLQAQAAVVAGATCQFLLMLADFDARGGVGWFVGLKSTAHWLAWACSMSPGAAREHVRVARALPSMPLTVTEFQAGRLSYSKVREIS